MPNINRKKSYLLKRVRPKGNILNDSDTGVDYLGYTVYAEALAQTIECVKTPVTVGIFARWGSGKSFLVKQVCSLLKRQQLQRSELTEDVIQRPQTKRSVCCRTLFLLVVVILIAFFAILASSPTVFHELSRINNGKEQAVERMEPDNITLEANFTQDASTQNSNDTSKVADVNTASGFFYSGARRRGWFRVPPARLTTNSTSSDPLVQIFEFGSITFLILIFIVVCLVMCCNGDYCSPTSFGNLRLLWFAAFTKLPIASNEKSIFRVDEDDVRHEMDQTSETTDEAKLLRNRRFIFVNFNAWEYAGSDNLWAGIATKLSDAVESEFGTMICRLFRIFDIETVSHDAGNPDVDDKMFFVKFRRDSPPMSIHEILQNYGVVRKVSLYHKWCEEKAKDSKLVSNLRDWWVVEYSNFREALSARTFLSRAGIAVNTVDPSGIQNGNGACVQDSQNIRANTSETDKEKLVSDETAIWGGESTVRNQNDNLNFCKHFRKYPKKVCKFPKLYWTILFIVSAVTIPLIVYLLAVRLNLEIFRSQRAIALSVQILAWLPGVTGACFVLFKFLWAMFHSQRNRINSVLEGTKASMASSLGLMDKVKYEVHAITKLIQCAEFTNNKMYTVVITIDDLDRVPLDKIKSVLEAVNILLSDSSSPFVCMIAVDSRIAVKCIEEGMGSALLKANVTGHEYLKKIINLPFCLPEVNNKNKKLFIEGLIEEAGVTEAQRILCENDTGENLDAGKNKDPANDDSGVALNLLPYRFPATSGSDNIDGKVSKIPEIITDGAAGDPIMSLHKSGFRRDSPQDEKEISDKSFLFDCRSFLYTDPIIRRHLHGNPRNIKRIFNVLSLTVTIINSSERKKRRQKMLMEFVEENSNNNSNFPGSPRDPVNFFDNSADARNEQLAKDITRWVVLTDLWPYRMSFIMQVIIDADQRQAAGRKAENILDSLTLFQIYENFVRDEITNAVEEHKSLLSLDADPDIFYSFLKELASTGLTKSRAKELSLYTINLDQSLLQNIAHQRSLADIKRSKEIPDVQLNKSLCQSEKQSVPQSLEDIMLVQSRPVCSKSFSTENGTFEEVGPLRTTEL